jgi:hypothetical protein
MERCFFLDDNKLMEYVHLFLVHILVKYFMPLWRKNIAIVYLCYKYLWKSTLVYFVEIYIFGILDIDVIEDKIIFIRIPTSRLDWHGDHRSYKLQLFMGKIEIFLSLRQKIGVLNALLK